MKGTLYKTEQGWMVKHPVATNFQHTYYHINPYHEKSYFLDEGSEVEFEIEDFWETGMEEVIRVATLVPMKEQTNGERFDEFMKLVEYPELEGTMNLCNDIINKKTGKMTEEEWQAAEKGEFKYKDGTPIRSYHSPKIQELLDEINLEEISEEELNKERNPNYKYFNIDGPTTEISDEEIKQYATQNASNYYEFVRGAVWYREKLKERQ
jgi:nitroimidazol reductase NimA-like FMN-containing flavoprotein (pyridoxamine 5'-phosphate oxidase superfamily)